MNDEEIKLRFEYVQKDIGKLESAVNLLTATIQHFRPQRQWPGFVTLLLIIVPLYALVIDLIAKGMKLWADRLPRLFTAHSAVAHAVKMVTAGVCVKRAARHGMPISATTGNAAVIGHELVC